MPLFSFEGKSPKIHPTAFIAATAVIIADVTIEERASVWYNAVLRGDFNPIVVRRGTAKNDRVTSACNSTRIGRVPSMLQTSAEPGTCRGRSMRNISDGLLTSLRPASFISKTPISLVDPKRFFTARKIRKL